MYLHVLVVNHYLIKIKTFLKFTCGHVICKECIKNNLCPIDELAFNYEDSNFPICQTIFQYLPEEKTKKFLCKCFEHKRIKFICEYDDEIFVQIVVKNIKIPLIKFFLLIQI